MLVQRRRDTRAALRLMRSEVGLASVRSSPGEQPPLRREGISGSHKTPRRRKADSNPLGPAPESPHLRPRSPANSLRIRTGNFLRPCRELNRAIREIFSLIRESALVHFLALL